MGDDIKLRVSKIEKCFSGCKGFVKSTLQSEKGLYMRCAVKTARASLH